MQPAYTARMAGGYSVTSQYQREMRIITPTPASVFILKSATALIR